MSYKEKLSYFCRRFSYWYVYIIARIGVPIHEFSHYLAARILGIKVKEMLWFKITKTDKGESYSGHLKYELPDNYTNSFYRKIMIITMAPYIPVTLLMLLYMYVLWYSLYLLPLGVIIVSLSVVVYPSDKDFELFNGYFACIKGKAYPEGEYIIYK